MKKDKYKFIGEKIKKARKGAGLLQSELAEKLKLKRATMSLIEKGERRTRIAELEKIAEIFNKDISYFLGESQHKPRPDLRIALRADDDLSKEAKEQILNFTDFIKDQETSLRKPHIGSARNMARKILKRAEISKPPVLLGEVIKKVDVSLKVIPFDFSDEISGALASSKEKDFITYNKNHHIHRQRFTVAHELGHLLLGHTSAYRSFDIEDKRPSEIEANQFAAELLMPISLVKTDIKKIKSAKDLAKRYWVSEEAMWWRLRQLNLIKHLVSS